MATGVGPVNPSGGLHSATVGRGPDLAMVHGWALHSGIWSPLLPSLSARFRTTAIDLPGHGRSPWHHEAASLDEFAARVVSSMEVVKGNQAWIMGWSLGGMVAMRLALLYPERVRGLILVATTPRFVNGEDWQGGVDNGLLDRFVDELHTDLRRLVVDFLTLQVRGDNHGREALHQLRKTIFAHGEPDRAALGTGLEILRDSDLRPELPGLRCPVLVISGQHDRLTPPIAGRYLAEVIPGARYVEIARAGHAPFLSHADEFLDSVTGYLATFGEPAREAL